MLDQVDSNYIGPNIQSGSKTGPQTDSMSIIISSLSRFTIFFHWMIP